MKDSKRRGINRRGFLKGAAVGAAGLVAQTPEIKAQQVQTARGAAALPSARALAAETEPVATDVDVLTADHPGSDFMVDVIKSLGIEYIAANPGSSFRALHESIINYGGNKNPELLTCCHEESSVFIADGYARVENKPMGVWRTAPSVYNTLQWASITRLRAACRFSSFSEIRLMSPNGGLESSGITAHRTLPRWFATTQSGTTCPYR